MTRFRSPLDDVRVAAPCDVDWDSMVGNDRQRFCGQCQLNVYNLSEMTRSEAETFVGRAEGRVCIRYYLRRDGSIITRNCPVGVRAFRRRMSRLAQAFGSIVLTFFAGVGAHVLAERVLMTIADKVLFSDQVPADSYDVLVDYFPAAEEDDGRFEVNGIMIKKTDLRDYERLVPLTTTKH